jgi:hypothetical protein
MIDDCGRGACGQVPTTGRGLTWTADLHNHKCLNHCRHDADRVGLPSSGLLNTDSIGDASHRHDRAGINEEGVVVANNRDA